ncbi:MAG: lipid-A-disaccharide synthase [Verrucomicrobiota bacterium]|jgi:lipid-A-disaccharide synthase
MPQSLFVIAGELSGDAHGAGLLRSLRRSFPELTMAGAGGPQMCEIAGSGLRDWVEDAAVMGVWEVLKHYRWFQKQFRELLDELVALKPDVLLLIDYPGFNLRFAKAVKARMPHVKIIYYISPQVWAWNRGRIPHMARMLDEMMCLFPFEEEIFSPAGLRTTFVGHPLVDELEAERVTVERDASLVGLFPGSREREVSRLFPLMLRSAEMLLVSSPHLRFSAPAASAKLASMMRQLVIERNLSNHITVTDGGSHALMQRAGCGVIASGTATLEAAYFGLPYLLVYKVAWPTFWLGKLLVRIRFIGLVNILAGRGVVKELIQSQAEPGAVVAELKRMLENPQARESLVADLRATATLLGGQGAHERAAGIVGEWLRGARKNSA